MIYIPNIWNDVLSKHLITVWAEESGKLEPGKYEWSFGNGLANSHIGYMVLARGRVIRAGLSVGSGTAGVSLTINEVDSGYLITTAGVNVFDVSLELQKGDILNFKTVASSGNDGNVSNGIVTVLIELDL
jgi:hypothetical protein